MNFQEFSHPCVPIVGAFVVILTYKVGLFEYTVSVG